MGMRMDRVTLNGGGRVVGGLKNLGVIQFWWGPQYPGWC